MTGPDLGGGGPTPWWRPVLHATPARAWMNDPNGLVRTGGVWHLFFQHHPDGVVWGPMSWGHATSPDLLTWTEQPVAIPALPTEHVFSGCVVRDDACPDPARSDPARSDPARPDDEAGGALVAVYTAVNPATDVQTQALATSDDGGATWRRHPANPVLDVGSTQWRDPKVFRHKGSDGEDRWVMVLVRALDHVVEVWRSKDLLTWERTGGTPPCAPAVDGEHYWEMPDLVRLPVEGSDRSEWVLLLSVNPGGPAGGSGQAYAVGRFDGSTFRFGLPDDEPHGPHEPHGPREPQEPLRGNAFGPFSWADHGPDLYAATTFHGLADDEPPVWIGWMGNWAYADVTPTSPWRGAATLARTLALREVDGALVLVQRPVLPAPTLVPAPTVLPVPTALPESGTAPEAALVTVAVTVPVDAAAGVDVLASPDGAQRTRVLVEHGADGPSLVVDRTRSGVTDFHPAFPVLVRAPLPGVRPDGDGVVRATLEVVVDRSSVEVFAADGATSVTALVFPDPASRSVLPVTCGVGSTSAVDVRALVGSDGRV